MEGFSTVLLVELFGDNHLPLRPSQALRLRSHEIQFSPVGLLVRPSRVDMIDNLGGAVS
jgi:hypothetical protein